MVTVKEIKTNAFMIFRHSEIAAYRHRTLGGNRSLNGVRMKLKGSVAHNILWEKKC